MLQWVLVPLLVMSLSGGALADEARQLRIDAARLIQVSENTETSTEERQALLEEAHAKLLEVREHYPSESTRIQLYLSGELISLSPYDVEDMIRSICLSSPSVNCVLALALKAARNIDMEDSSLRNHVLFCVAERYAQVGDITGAFRALEGFDVSNLIHIARQQAEAGDITGALQIVQQILQGKSIDANEILLQQFSEWTLIETASAEAKAGDLTSAHQAVEGINTLEWRAQALIEIAAAQAKAGDAKGATTTFADARRSAQSADYLGETIRLLIGIATAQAEAGDKKGATATLADARQMVQSNYPVDYEPPWDLVVAIAAAQAKVGDRKGATATFASLRQEIQSIDEWRYRGIALADLAYAQAKAEDTEGATTTLAIARQAAQGIDDKWVHTETLVDIAAAEAAITGDKNGATATLASLRQAAISIDEKWPHNRTLAMIADAQAKAGDFVGALRSAMGINDKSSQAINLAAITNPTMTMLNGYSDCW